jgi:hypothetical protein
MLTKDHHCLESIIEAVDRIIEYTSGFDSGRQAVHPRQICNGSCTPTRAPARN